MLFSGILAGSTEIGMLFLFGYCFAAECTDIHIVVCVLPGCAVFVGGAFFVRVSDKGVDL
jgi:hypothetical protein